MRADAMEIARHGRVDFAALDVLRALGAIMVLTTHVAFWAGEYGENFLGRAVARLDVGVALFFVLSGFLLSLPYLRRRSEGAPPPPVGRYYYKRALRILPVYWISVVLALTLLPGNDQVGLWHWIQDLTLTRLYFGDRLSDGLTQMWSLTTEVTFYLVLPLLMWFWNAVTARGQVGIRIGGLILAAAALSWAWFTQMPERMSQDWPFYLQWLPAQLIWFVIGIALAHMHLRLRTEVDDEVGGAHWLQALGRQPGVCWTLTIALFLLACTPLAGPAALTPATSAELVFKIMTYAVIACLMVLPSVFGDEGAGYQRLLAHPLLRRLGYISYGIFCVHLIVLELVVRVRSWALFEGHFWQMWSLTMAITVALSVVLYRCVEVPSMRLREFSLGARARKATKASGITSDN